MDKICVIGAGGLGRETIMVIEDINMVKRKYSILGIIDDNENVHGQYLNNHQILGGTKWIKEHEDEDIKFVFGIGEPETKIKILKKIINLDIEFETIVHPSVIKSDHIKFGKGTVITAGCILTVNIIIGDHVFLNLNTIVGHDSIIKDFSIANPTICINGKNTIGEGVYLGTGCKLIHNVEIGDWS
ncbi:MAG: transferase, partial [Thermoplasmata archaeon]|nr:transferase [Thermoplasmata archaeon]